MLAFRIVVGLCLVVCFLRPWDLQAQAQAQDRMEPCRIEFQEKIQEAGIHHVICPDSAVQDIPLTGHFTIPTALHARVRFWHQVFTQFSVKDYVIHVSEHPHIILEVVSFPWLDAQGNLDKKARTVLKERHRYYKDVLRRMDQNSSLASEKATVDRLNVMLKDIPGRFRKAALDLRSQKGQRELMHRGIEMSSPYLKHIEEEFASHSLPPELALLAFVESTFNIKAVSKVKASGVYQIMPFIARQYMKLTAAIDERLDPIKSGAVAARILKHNFELLGSWPLAITAYNHGPYGIKAAVKKSRSEDIVTLIESYNGRAFGFASQNFYAEFLAVVYAIKHVDEHFAKAKRSDALSFRNETIERPIRVRDLCKRLGVTVEALQALNPDLTSRFFQQNGLVPRNYRIKVPLAH